MQVSTAAARTLSVAGLVLFWAALAALNGDPQVLPGPARVLPRMWAELMSGELLVHLGATLLRVLAAFVVAMAVGIALGLAQARAAVAAIAAGSPESYERAWQRLSWRHNLLTSSLLSVSSRPMLRRALVPAADRLPVVFRAAFNELARPA